MAEALREDYADRLDETGRDYARRIVEAVQRLDRLLKDLLTYSRLSHEEAEVRLCSLDAAVRIGAIARGRFRRLWMEDNGIGLAIVRKSIESQGGQAGMEAPAGGGSRFWIGLPGGTE